MDCSIKGQPVEYAFVAFYMFQMDGTYMFKLESFIPTLCQLVQGTGEDQMALRLRAAGLQALSSMVLFSMLLFYITILSSAKILTTSQYVLPSPYLFSIDVVFQIKYKFSYCQIFCFPPK